MELIILPLTKHYSIPLILVSSLVVAGLLIALITALDYRTWNRPAKRRAARRAKADRLWYSLGEQGGCIIFLVAMLLLVSILSVVMLVDTMLK